MRHKSSKEETPRNLEKVFGAVYNTGRPLRNEEGINDDERIS